MKNTEFKKYLPIIKTSLLSSVITLIFCMVCFPINTNHVQTVDTAYNVYTDSYIEEVHDAIVKTSTIVTEKDITGDDVEALIKATPVAFTARDFEELYKVTSSNELVDSEDEEFTATETPAILIYNTVMEEPEKVESNTVEEDVPIGEIIKEQLKQEQPEEVETPTIEEEPKTEDEVVEIPSAEDVAEEDNSESGMTYIGNFRITGYDSCAGCNGNSSGLTAMGTYITPGRSVAMGKNYPLGTKIYIEGLGYRTVEDRGNFPSTTIDVAVHSHNEAYAITGHYDVYLVEG